MTDDSDAITQLAARAATMQALNLNMVSQESVLQQVSNFEATTDGIISQYQTDLQAFLTARQTNTTTPNLANTIGELRALETVAGDLKNAVSALIDEVRTHRAILRYIKNNYAGG